jgi:3-oxoacyl-[acyl-carrier-protein] synthase-3
MIAASIPLALKLAIDGGKIHRGDKVALIGTSAGFSIGALALEY